MPLYRIVWEIDLDALNPGQAARLAREVQLDPTSTATVFEVTNRKTGRRWTADSNIGQAGHPLTDLPAAVCTCADRSWYGPEHDGECLLQGRRP